MRCISGCSSGHTRRSRIHTHTTNRISTGSHVAGRVRVSSCHHRVGGGSCRVGCGAVVVRTVVARSYGCSNGQYGKKLFHVGWLMR